MLTVIDIIIAGRQLGDKALANYQAIEQHFNSYDSCLCAPNDFECMSILLRQVGRSGRLGQNAAFDLGCIYANVQGSVRALDVNKIFDDIDSLTRFCRSCHPALVFLKEPVSELKCLLEKFMMNVRCVDAGLNEETVLVHIKQLFDYFSASLIMKKYPESIVYGAAYIATNEMKKNPVCSVDEVDLDRMLDLDWRFDECTASDIWLTTRGESWGKKQLQLVDFFVRLESIELLELFVARYAMKINPKQRADRALLAINNRQYLSIWSTEKSRDLSVEATVSTHEIVVRATG